MSAPRAAGHDSDRHDGGTRRAMDPVPAPCLQRGLRGACPGETCDHPPPLPPEATCVRPFGTLRCPRANASPVSESIWYRPAVHDKIILIGASTGGTEAIKEVLVGLPEVCPPVMIVQHMPEMFTPSFARRLDGLCRIRVKEAEQGERLEGGVAYLAPGHSHLRLSRRGATLHCELSKAEPVNRHRPSVDVLFDSAVPLLGSSAVAVLLTGMGKDGARGLLKLRQAGLWTIAQNQDSCVVYGMPREAVMLGAAAEVLPLKAIAEHVLARFGINDRRAS